MQSLCNFFGNSTESQGLGLQNPQNLPATKNIAINSQEKAAAFFKILSDCSPEAGLHAFSSEMAGKAEVISPDMPANMSGLIPLKNFDKLQENFNITFEGLSPEAVDSACKSNSDEKRIFVKLFLNPKHSFSSRVNSNEDTGAESEKKDETTIDPAINPEFFLATTDDYTEAALPVNLTEKILSDDFTEDPIQKDEENITAPQSSSANTFQKNSINLNNSQVPTPTVSIDISKETIQTLTVSIKTIKETNQLSNVSNATGKETIHPSIVSNDHGKEKFQPLAVSNLTGDLEDQEHDIPNQQQKEMSSVKKGIEKSQIFQSDPSTGEKPGSITDTVSTNQAVKQKPDTTQQGPGLWRLYNQTSTPAQSPVRQSDEVQSAISNINATSENLTGSEFPIENKKKPHRIAERESVIASEKGLQKSQDKIADVSTRGFDNKKFVHNNSQEKSSGEHKGSNQHNADTNKENQTLVVKDNTIQKNLIFQKIHDNDALKSDSVPHSDVVKQSETKLSQSDTHIPKQPEPSPIPSLAQNQTENRMPINMDPLQQTELNTGSEVDKTMAKIGDGKPNVLQMDQIRPENSPEERADVIRQIVQHMNYRQIGTRSQMVVQLKPESLGRLRMQIETSNQQVTVKMISSSNSAKEIIEQQLHTLKQELKGHGLEVQKIDVTVQSDSDQQRNGHPSGTFHQNAQQKEYHNKRQQMSQQGNRSIKNNGSVTEADPLDTQMQNTDKSEVDYFA